MKIHQSSKLHNRRCHASSWRHGSYHMLLAFECELNPVYADGRPILQDIYAGRFPSAPKIIEPSDVHPPAEQGQW